MTKGAVPEKQARPRRELGIESQYELELDKVITFVKQEQAKVVCIQFPRGLASKSMDIAEIIEAETEAKCVLWIGPTFGACDLPTGLECLNPKIEHVIHFGHAKWKYKDDIAAGSSELSVHEI
ncbi:MAG TPA: hypothetical protein HA282_01160 [Nanoarchaeota archaeon]|nr:hypothetical protein [Candidatus Pacearchaeota archaeon]HIH17961.1 hypothetical protein [Nanoarchaeota archaeon]HIH33829.1 hypothetical protein [Nanoarchaeota archaeon]HIH50772.1 hypothetical protein [Nanoarchaeota archaeon]HIH65808.1 hypothetical protein [Nanoarchaeota archaeon]